MIRAPAFLLLAPLLAAASVARAGDLAQVWAQQPDSQGQLAQSRIHMADDLARFAGTGHRSRVLAVPLVSDAHGYSLCLLYDYRRTDLVDPISGSGFAARSGGNDAHNLGLGLRTLMTERLEFEAVVGHSHVNSSSDSAYGGLIYDVAPRFGLGADLGRINAGGQDGNRLRAFARFYF